MAAAATQDEPSAAARDEQKLERTSSNGEPAARDSESEDDDEDEADDEPKLKYSRLTSSLAPVYRNGDATSTFLVAGDKMVGHSTCFRLRAPIRRRTHAEFQVDCRQP